MSRTIRNGIKIFLSITVITLLIIFLLTFSEETLNSLSKMKPIYFLYAFIVLIIYYYLDAVKLKLIAKALNHNISIATCFDIIISGIFLAAVTPFQTGGMPVQLYILNKENISYGESTLILFMRGLLAFVFYFIAIPFILGIYSNAFSSSIVKILTRYLLVVYGLGIVFVTFAILAPDKIIKGLYKLDILLKRLKLLKSDKIIKAISWFEKEITFFLTGLRFFFKSRKTYILLSLILTFISFSFFYSIALIIILGLGVGIKSPIEIINLQFLHAFLVMFMPTPGASGISETLFFTLFSSVCKKELLGIYAILWRFFTFYLGAAVGGFLTLKIINKSGKTYDDLAKNEKNNQTTN